ncbi:MAG: chromate efflux transporter [Pseudomonadota bacterium]
MTEQTPHPSLWEGFKFWFKLGFISFGGPTGQISIMYQELVERRKWISNSRFLHALNYCMLLPGPEAKQLAIYIGWLLHKTVGGVMAGSLFIIPSIFILFGLSFIYASYGKIPWVVAIFSGLKPAVMAIVAAAVINIAHKALKNEVMITLGAAAFIAIFFFKVPFPVIILGAGLIGLFGGMYLPDKFVVITEKDGDSEETYVQYCEEAVPCHIEPSTKRSLFLILVFLALWIIPMGGLLAFTSNTVFIAEGLFFTKAAFLTFGGAYAVLAYIAQAGVEQFAWLTGPQMIDGLGLAETTPGPLIMVVQFVGFMAGWNYPGSINPLLAGLVGSLVATYFTFLPSFLFIFLGGPYIENTRGNKKLSATLSAITASVVGVVLNLAVWFGMNVLFPETGTFNWFGLVMGLTAFAALQWGKIGMIPVIIGSAALGFIWNFLASQF